MAVTIKSGFDSRTFSTLTGLPKSTRLACSLIKGWKVRKPNSELALSAATGVTPKAKKGSRK
ncbi:hypothetical protein D3C72_2597810 [compost metagenome]